MGTTITAAIVDLEAEEVAIGHVGDSRAYRLRGGKFERLTRDHSLVEEMRRKGQLTDAQAEDHPQRSIITRALGPEPEVEVDLQTVPAQAGDVFLICSDGLTTMLDDEQIGRLLARATSMQSAVRALVDEANRAGGRDNITVIAFRLDDAAMPAAAARAPGRWRCRGRDPDRLHRRGGRPDRDRGAPPRRRRGRPEAPRGARQRQAAPPPAHRRQGAGRCWSCSPPSPSAPGTATARSGSSAPTTPAASPSTAACPTSCPSGSSSTTSATPARSRPRSLPPRRRDAVTGHDLRSREDAVSLIEDIQKSQGVP